MRMLQITPLPKTPQKKNSAYTKNKEFLRKPTSKATSPTLSVDPLPNSISVFWVNKNWNHKLVDPHIFVGSLNIQYHSFGGEDWSSEELQRFPRFPEARLMIFRIQKWSPTQQQGSWHGFLFHLMKQVFTNLESNFEMC